MLNIKSVKESIGPQIKGMEDNPSNVGKNLMSFKFYSVLTNCIAFLCYVAILAILTIQKMVALGNIILANDCHNNVFKAV